MNFTVLIPVYNGDKASQVKDAIESIIRQTVPASSILVLVDGPVSDELKESLISSSQLDPSIKLEWFPKNRGLPVVLNEGLKLSETEWIFRMDADDIAMENRFEKQIDFLKANPDVVLLGAQVSEFDSNTRAETLARSVPLTHSQISKLSLYRNPFNHPTVAYKKSVVMEVGGYNPSMTYFEDYELWLRILNANYLTHNLPDTLVSMRTDKNFIKRRSGWKYLKHEYNFLKASRRNGFINSVTFLILVVIRLPLRILPSRWISFIYEQILRKSNS